MFNMSKSDWKAASIWFLLGLIVSALFFAYAQTQHHPFENWYNLGIVLIFILPLYAAFAAVLSNRYKQMCLSLIQSSKSAKTTSVLKKYKKHKRIVEIKYAFKCPDGQVFERKKEYLVKQIAKKNFLKELENESLTILYNPENPKSNIWEFETTYYK